MALSQFTRQALYYAGCLVICFLLSSKLSAQLTTISGVINRYAVVLDVDTCYNSLLIDNATGFAVGDRVLLIQMKGAEIDESNTSSFGTVTSFGTAGNYEFGEIAEVKGLFVTLKNKIIRLYDLSKPVQLVRVPQYTNASVQGTLTGLPWDGFHGGIIVLEATGNVTLVNTTIDASGIGFRGGDSSENAAYKDDIDYYYTRTSKHGGIKGEGIAEYKTIYEAGTEKVSEKSSGASSIEHD